VTWPQTNDEGTPRRLIKTGQGGQETTTPGEDHAHSAPPAPKSATRVSWIDKRKKGFAERSYLDRKMGGERYRFISMRRDRVTDEARQQYEGKPYRSNMYKPSAL
jgi:hypothetical protein